MKSLAKGLACTLFAASLFAAGSASAKSNLMLAYADPEDSIFGKAAMFSASPIH